VFATVNFADANIVTSTGDLSTVAVGDEITITETGRIAHITAIETGTSTYTLTLDTDIGTAGDVVQGVFENWQKVNDNYTSSDGEYKKLGGFATNTWIQFKVLMVGDIELRQFISKGNSKTEL